MPHTCPSCSRPLISRLGPCCAFCGAKLPAYLLFSESERARIAAADQARKNDLAKFRAERKKQVEAVVTESGSAMLGAIGHIGTQTH